MLAYLVRRLGQMVITLFVVSIVVFLISQFMPGGPATALLGMSASEEAITEVRAEMGLNKPIYVQYLNYYSDILLHGDFGNSLISGQPIRPMLVDKISLTFMLAIGGLTMGVLIGIPLGLISGLQRHEMVDDVLTTISFAGVSTPGFWLAVMFIYVFGVWLNWLPTYGYTDVFTDPVAGIKHLILPIVSIGIIYTAVIQRFVRTEVIDNLNQEYTMALKSKGLPPHRVYLQIVKNSLIPAVTIIGLGLGRLLSAALVIEVVYAIPGSGRAIYNAVLQTDIPVIQGFVLIIAIVMMLATLVTDIVYTVLDPRINY